MIAASSFRLRPFCAAQFHVFFLQEVTMYQGQSIRVAKLDGGIAELCFDRQNDAINKFDAATVKELGEAAAALARPATSRAWSSPAARTSSSSAPTSPSSARTSAAPKRRSRLAFEANKIFSAIEDL
ncbi:hypothetical protein, partial [Oleomonas cavernae]|uniref:hypothetical protein n=1 Tax=Oleomonas cavernae TaxID=2320859 RepID=UPI0018F3670B